MLGGAGPAIAAVPLVVVWAGGSTITLIRSVARGKVGALGSASRVGFVVTMSIGQVHPETKKKEGFSALRGALMANDCFIVEYISHQIFTL